jgi:hypothetical protein
MKLEIQARGKRRCRRPQQKRRVKSETMALRAGQAGQMCNNQWRDSDSDALHSDPQEALRGCLVPSGSRDVNGRLRLGSRQAGGGESERRVPGSLLGCGVFRRDNRFSKTRKSHRRVLISRKQHMGDPERQRRPSLSAENQRERRGTAVYLVCTAFVVHCVIALTLVQAHQGIEPGPVETDPKKDSEQSVMELLIGRPFVGYPQHPVKVIENAPTGDPVQPKGPGDGVQSLNNGTFAKRANSTGSNSASNIFEEPSSPADLGIRRPSRSNGQLRSNDTAVTPTPKKSPSFYSGIPGPSQIPDSADDGSFHRETLSDVPSTLPSVSVSPSPRIGKSTSKTMHRAPAVTSARDSPHLGMGMITPRPDSASPEGVGPDREGHLDVPPKRQMKVATSSPSGPAVVRTNGQPPITQTKRRKKRKARNVFARANTTVSLFNVTSPVSTDDSRLANHHRSNAWTRQRQWHLAKHLSKKSGKKKSKRSRKKRKGKGRKKKGMESASSKAGMGQGKGIRTGCPTPASRATAAPTSSPFPTGLGLSPTSVPTREGGIIATPTSDPTSVSTTQMPTLVPTTTSPTAFPTTASPTAAPTTASPTVAPTTAIPTGAPSSSPPPSAVPTVFPFQRFQTSVELQAAVDQYMLGGNNQMAMVCRLCHVDSGTRVNPEIVSSFVFIFCAMSLLP